MLKVTVLGLAVLCSAFISANCRSLISKRDVQSEGNVWVPDGMSEDEWFSCHGYPCDQWERTKQKLMLVKLLATKEDQSIESVFEELNVTNEDPLDCSIYDRVDRLVDIYKISRDDDLDGCIWLTEEQIDEILESKGFKNPNSEHDSMMRKKRQVDNNVVNGFGKWPMPVHYKFDGEHSTREQDYIRTAVAHIEEETCVRFQEVGTHETFNDYHIIVTRRNTGCHSFIGRTGLRPQQLNLQPGCIFSFGIPVHEFTHALGVWHEMQRWDRDEHINVLWDNIDRYRSQFSLRHYSSDLGTEYDTGSVMHYAGKDGAINGLNSMETKNPLYQRNMGQRTGLSFKDAQLLNKLYCNDKCTNQLPEPCMRGGYQDPNNCHQCKCPPGFTGTYCEQLAPSNANCGGEYTLSTDGTEVTIQSPSYDTLRYYQVNDECNWRFQAPAGYKVSFRFVDDFGVYCGYRDACFHWVEVQYEAHRNTQGPRFCCRDAPREAIVSEWNEMTVLLRTNYSPVYSTSRRGFRAVIHAVPDPDQSTPPTTPTPPSTPSPDTNAPTTTTTPTPTTTVDMNNMEDECVPVDLSIALDSSGSVTNYNWQKLIRFSRDLLMRMVVSPNCALVSMISIGTRGYLHSRLNEHVTKQAINDVIYRMPFRDEWTNTGSAFRVMTSDVYVSSNGDRSNAMNVAIVITDGPSNRERELTIPSAQAARERGLEILTIGVGSDVDEPELRAITNDADRNIYVDDFDTLMDQNFIQSIFNQIKEIVGVDNGDEDGENEEEEEEEEEENGDGDFSWSCSFEDSNGYDTWCDVTQATDDDFDWSFGNGPTPSDPTGPDTAQSGLYYIFIEATNRRQGDQAVLKLPQVPTTNTYCLSFAYHMYGWHIDTLYVSKETQGGTREVEWSQSGQKGNTWLNADVNVSLNKDERLVFIGQRGAEYSGDIGLDSIELKTGSCS